MQHGAQRRGFGNLRVSGCHRDLRQSARSRCLRYGYFVRNRLEPGLMGMMRDQLGLRECQE